ncbi:hypothetical protein TELCIR_20330, partial [Teladorsagia circumcincta]
APFDKSEPAEPSAPVDKAEPAEPAAPLDESGGSEPTRDDDKPTEPVVPSAPPLIPMPEPESNVTPGPDSVPDSDHGPASGIIEIPKADDDTVGPASPSKAPHEHDDSLPNPPFHVDVTPAEPFVPPSFRREGQASPSDLLIDDVPEEFKGPHTPQEIGENGLLDNLEEPVRVRKISMDTDDLEKALEAVGSAYEGLVDLASTVTDTVSEGVKDATEMAQEKMKAMQTRSSLVENDGDNRPVKYEETDPVIDSVLETVATDSDRVDHALSNGGSGMENKENGKRPDHEVDEDGFRLASGDHDIRLHLPPLTAPRGNRAVAVPHLSRPLFFELVTVPHLHGKCTLTDEQSAVEYFTNIRSANYILHSEDVSPAVLDGWLAGKKQWFRDEHKCRLIPTRHHSALLAFVTAHAAEMEEHGLVMNSSLEHNSISINTEEGREDYHMIKIEL